MFVYRVFSGVLAGALLAACVSAQQAENVLTQKAISAGYKAAFVCSATFNANKPLDAIEAYELDGIAADYKAHFDILGDAEIDTEAKRVSVLYDAALLPRVAQWRPYLGCSQLPPLSTADDAADALPRITLPDVARDDQAPWRRHAEINAPAANEALQAAVDKAFAAPGEGYGAGARTSALLIATPNEILFERYLDGMTIHTSQRTWSVAKSIGASVIGAAVQDGLISVDAPASLKAWQAPGDPRRQITLANLLNMASGLDSDARGNRTDRLYFGGGTVAQTAVQASLEAVPGARWKYANNDTLLALRSLREAIGDDPHYWRYPFAALLHKIGMHDTVPEMDWGGDFVLSSQVWTTARDMARLGILHLQDGMWNGERILPAGWANYVATPAPSQPGSGQAGYGAQWWLYGLEDRTPELPAGTYAARGNRGQIIMVVPQHDLVIVRRGYDLAGKPGFEAHHFTRDVLNALGLN